MNINEITELVAGGQTEEALDALKKDAKIFQDEITLLNARYENLEKRVIQGTISEEVRNLETNRINADILELIQNYKKKAAAMASAKATAGTAKVKPPSVKPPSAGRKRSLARSILIPLGLLLAIAIGFIVYVFFFMPDEERPLEEKGEQKPKTEERVEERTSPIEAGDSETKSTAVFKSSRKFSTGTISSEENGKISHESMTAYYGNKQIMIEFKIENRFDVPITIGPFKLSDFAANGREGSQFYQQKAENIAIKKMAPNETYIFKPIFNYTLDNNRKFHIYFHYEVPDKGIGSRGLNKFTLHDK